MADLAQALSQIPFLGAYRAREEQLRQQPMQELQQVSGAVNLMGAMQQQQQRQQAIQKEGQLRDALSALGPDASHEQVIGAVSRFGTPDKLIQVHQDAMNRAATLAATKEANAARIDQLKANAEERKYRADRDDEFRYQQLADRTSDNAEKRRIEAEQLARQEKRDREHEITLRMIASMRGENSSQAKIPSGYRSTPTGNLEAIPGGPADTKIQGALNQDTAALQSATAALNRLGEQVNLVKGSNLGRITGVAGVLPNIPGSEGADASARLEALKSQVGFGVLQQLKDSAKAGSSGLGQVTEKEHIYLQQQLGNLTNAQSEQEIRRVLNNISSFVENAKSNIQNAYNMKHGQNQQQIQPTVGAPSVGPSLEDRLKRYQ